MTFYKKNLTFILTLLIFCFSFLFTVHISTVNAQSSDTPSNAAQQSAENRNAGGNTDMHWLTRMAFVTIGSAISLIVSLMGDIFTLLTGALSSILSYDSYTTQEAVTKGWKIVLDFCNMFFILILLVIAFATILRRESYSAKQLLGKLLIAAVLINFSKTICGLILEFAQVLMTTFASTLSDGQIADMLKVNNYLQFAFKDDMDPVTLFNTVVGLIFSFIFLLISSVVILVLLAILIMRVMMIWIYVVLSPLAFLLSTFPAGQQYAQKWWTNFTQQVVTGPVLSFFIWLAFSISFAGDQKAGLTGANKELCGQQAKTQIACLPNFMEFFIGVSFLIGGVIVTQQMGGMAGAVAGKGLGILKGGAYKFSGARAIRERYQAFQGHRESARKEKVAASGQKLYGAYEGIKAAPGAVTRGLKRATTMREGSAATRSISEMYADVRGEEYKEKIKEKREKKEREKKEKQQRIENYDKRQYEVERDGKKVMINENDDDFDKNVFHEKTLSQTAGAFRDNWNAGMTKSRAIRNQINEQQAQKQQQEWDAAGLKTNQIANVLENSSSSQTEKMAAALSLAVKEGFKSNKQVETARNVIGNNAPLLNKFNDTIDENQAHFGYNLERDTQGNYINKTDVDKFKNRHNIGKIKASSVIKSGDANAMHALQQDMEGPNFTAAFNEASKTASKSQRTVIDTAMLKNRDNENLKKDKAAQAHAKITGRYNESFAKRKEDGSLGGDIDMDALGSFVNNANAATLAEMNLDMLDKTTFTKDGRSVEEYEEFMKTIGKNLQTDQIKALARNEKVKTKIKESLKAAMIFADSNKKAELDADQDIARINEANVNISRRIQHSM